eukprot:3803891-Rhodomonas_salina.1
MASLSPAAFWVASPTVLRTRYAISGTDIRYAPRRSQAVFPSSRSPSVLSAAATYGNPPPKKNNLVWYAWYRG